MIRVTRSVHNPLLQPNPEEAWEAEAVFNGCPIVHNDGYKLLYRAISLPHYHALAKQHTQISDIGIADSIDGIHFTNRKKFIVPEKAWERFGCEDPRVTKIDDKYYITYTAISDYPFAPGGIRVAIAISDTLDSIQEKHLATPFNAKAMSIFPQTIGGKYTAILTAHTDMPPAHIAIAQADRLEDFWDDTYWKVWHANLEHHTIDLLRFPEDHVEVGAPPIKTPDGWLLLYSYISNYQSNDRVFAIEAVLLDTDDPKRIIARTAGPLLTPEASYERYGFVPNVIFPSGALVEDDVLSIYYGAADHTVCRAETSLQALLTAMKTDPDSRVRFTRFSDNPILTPIKENKWESVAVFNPAAVYINNTVHIVYRAMGDDNTSVMGYATSRDGVHIDERAKDPIYIPRAQFETKLKKNGFSGCEDPRITRMKDTLYMCYTAYDSVHPPRVALTSIGVDDFIAQRVHAWKDPVLISPPNYDNKDACLFPDKVNGKYLFLHRMGVDIDIGLTNSLEFDGSTWLEEHRWLRPRKGTWDSAKVGIASPPFLTENGWILLYHGVSERDKGYRVGALLLDKENPLRIIGRTNHPIFEPKEPYELHGMVPNVVFPCGSVVIDNTVFIYYGGADQVIGVASVSLTQLLDAFC